MKGIIRSGKKDLIHTPTESGRNALSPNKAFTDGANPVGKPSFNSQSPASFDHFRLENAMFCIFTIAAARVGTFSLRSSCSTYFSTVRIDSFK